MSLKLADLSPSTLREMFRRRLAHQRNAFARGTREARGERILEGAQGGLRIAVLQADTEKELSGGQIAVQINDPPERRCRRAGLPAGHLRDPSQEVQFRRERVRFDRVRGKAPGLTWIASVKKQANLPGDSLGGILTDRFRRVEACPTRHPTRGRSPFLMSKGGRAREFF